MNLPMLVMLVGLVVGTILVLTACAVWYRTQTLGLGGGVLTGFGVILMLISIVTEIRFEVTSTGPKIEILRQQLVQTAEAVEQVAGEARQITEELESSQQNIRHLTEAIRRTPGLPLDARILLRDSVHIRPGFQPAQLDSAVMNLGSVQRALSTMPRRDP
jgi:uncharacterized membrane protein YcjF (UPF0283 family)